MIKNAREPKIYLTSYAEGDGTYGAYIQAHSWERAEQLALARGLNEQIEGELMEQGLPHRLRELIAEKKWIEAAHEACFLSFVGVTSGALTAREALGDTGLIHELFHLHSMEQAVMEEYDKARYNATIRRVAALAEQFEWRVPGWPHSNVKPGLEDDATEPAPLTLRDRGVRFLSRLFSRSADSR